MMIHARIAAVMAVLCLVSNVRGQEMEVAFPSLTFSLPVDLQDAGDGTDRIFVVEQSGLIKVFSNSSSATQVDTFLDIKDSITAGGEMGLLGLAFHPDYKNNGYFYVNYTRTTDSIRSYISRFNVSQADPNKADPSSELKVLVVTQPPFQNHKAGQVAFGPDGYLYAALGDGGSGGDPRNYAQNRAVLLGKILRIDIDHPSEGMNYGIPSDNPFAGNTSGYREEVWAYGFRNPWRFSFDPMTGKLWCGDVGQDTREEVDIVEKGLDYGWRIMEGTFCFNPSTGCDPTGLTLPVWDYGRSDGATVIGGYVYRGSLVPELFGRYIVGDYVSGRIWAIADSVSPPLVEFLGFFPGVLSSFGVDQQNELYACSYDGKIYRFPTTVSSAGPGSTVVSSFHLFQNYPNPFNPATTISYELPERGTVTLVVYDLLGRAVNTLVMADQSPGTHSIRWDASAHPSGLYVCRLSLLSASRRMLDQSRGMLLVR